MYDALQRTKHTHTHIHIHTHTHTQYTHTQTHTWRTGVGATLAVVEPAVELVSVLLQDADGAGVVGPVAQVGSSIIKSFISKCLRVFLFDMQLYIYQTFVLKSLWKLINLN